MDALKLRQIFEKLDQALEHPTELLIRGGAAVLAYGLEQRVTIDIDVLPASRFVEVDLRRACAAADLGFNPSDKDFAERAQGSLWPVAGTFQGGPGGAGQPTFRH